MGQTVKDPRVSKERGNPLGTKQDNLTVASDTAARDLVGANGLPAAAIAIDVDGDGVKGTYWILRIGHEDKDLMVVGGPRGGHQALDTARKLGMVRVWRDL